MTRRSIWLAILAQAFAAQCSNDSCLGGSRTRTPHHLSFPELQASPTGTPIRRTTTTTVHVTSTKSTRKTSSITSETDDSGNHIDLINRDGLGSLLGQALQERRVTTSPTPTTLPLYATECASEADYSSACSSGNGTGTIGSTIYTGKPGRKTSSTRPTTLFTSRLTSSKGASSESSGSGSKNVSSLSQSSTAKTTVHVVTIAALTTTKQPIRVNTKSTLGQITGKTTGAHYTNSTAALATASAIIVFLMAQRHHECQISYPPFLPPGTGTRVFLTIGTGVIITTAPFAYPTSTSARIPFPFNTTAFWFNGTATTALPAQGTGTGIGTGILVTGTGYYNTSTPTSTLSASPTATEDLTCGETSTPFSLRVSQPGGTFNKIASSLSVAGTGHLCAVGYNDSNEKPRVAAVASAGGTGDGTGDEEGGEGPCTTEGEEGLSCRPANSPTSAGAGASAGGGGGWVGCGLMLSLGDDIDVGYGGLNCSSVSLEVVET
ncbi:hypothetical protein QBC32DRAFT_397148 [Pseudoneurospora amorphoporcata]|uniref:Uncharacterized protein n=1 Tax=Pseudoneurospora amorphoporcata TaxID=241081 RepID=A0AAN6SHG2_9PEZI|nr:hypothetical protein QBC32DRAFT_397148 [Pseudoneurospora amorphoporcata]